MTSVLKHTAALAAVIGLSVFCVVPAAARNTVVPLSIAEGMASPEVHGKIDGTVQFYFGDTKHPAVLQDFGAYVTNRKSSSFLISDEKSCQRVFATTLIELQKRAHELGANAVINIHSYYDKEDVSSDTNVQCHAGGVMAGIALRGEFVKVANP
jgi:uncharacterized protein YbjQ (UPF0145 family)